MNIKEKGKPTIFLWEDYREKNSIARKKYNEETLANYDKLINEVYRLVKEQKIDSETRMLFEQNLLVKHQEVFFSSCDWLFQLSHYFEELNQLIYNLAKHKSTNIRLRIVQNLMSCQPNNDLTNFILSESLNDTKNIKTFGLLRIVGLKKTEFIPTLKEHLKNEQSYEERIELERSIALLEKGYFNEENGHLTIKNENGYSFERIENFNPIKFIKKLFH